VNCKRLIMLVLMVLFIKMESTAVMARVIENSDKPLSKKAGRQAKLTEVLRISDGGEKFYFKYPQRIEMGKDGSIYVMDRLQLLKFGKNGKFIKNLQKVGEGPNEYKYISYYRAVDNQLLVKSFLPPKFLKLDLSGKLIKEYRVEQNRGIPRVIWITKEKYYYLLNRIEFSKAKNGVFELQQMLHVAEFNKQPKYTDLKLNLPSKFFNYIYKTGRGALWRESLEKFVCEVENEQSAFISHTSDYLIKQVDLASGKIIRQFKRKYEPVPFIPQKREGEEEAYREYLKRKKYFSDIMAMGLFRGKLLVFTSSLDKKKGVLVDIFSKEGKYIDSVYIRLPRLKRPDSIGRRSLRIVGDFLLNAERDAEGNISIVKYKLEI